MMFPKKYRIIEYKVISRGVNFFHCDKKYEVQFKWLFVWLRLCEFEDRDTAESWVEAVKELAESKKVVVYNG